MSSIQSNKRQAPTRRTPFNLFCEISSIRGMHKIPKAPTRFLRTLWTTFVLCMTICLCLVSGLLVKDYLNYYTAWHISTDFTGNTTFPSMTLCSHNPFSERAEHLWQTGKIFSPKQFQNFLFNMSVNSIKNNLTNQQKVALLMDSIENYYLALTHKETIELSHGNEMFLYCVVLLTQGVSISQGCKNEEVLNRKIFSHGAFYNCWTFKIGEEEYAKRTQKLTILVSLTPTSSIKSLKYAFLNDVMERGEGLKVTIHEPDMYPEIDIDGIDVQPGKMNNIKYQLTKWSRRHTPKQPCTDERTRYTHFGTYYNYTFRMCINHHIQQEVIDKCSCMLATYPRNRIPDKRIGYCLNFINTDQKKLNCSIHIIDNVEKLIKKLENTVCKQRCHYSTYKSDFSITRWKPAAHKITKLTNLIINSDKLMIDQITANEYISFLRNQILPESYSTSNSLNLTENHFTLISLSRKTKSTIVQNEQLVLDLAILVSRIGGLCSLFTGLTVSFFIELIEFIYLLIRQRNYRKENNNNNNNNNNTSSNITYSPRKLSEKLLNDEITMNMKSNNPHSNDYTTNRGGESGSGRDNINEMYDEIKVPNNSSSNNDDDVWFKLSKVNDQPIDTNNNLN